MVIRMWRRMIGTGWLSKGTVPVIAAMLLTACGFHLQGRQPLPEAFTYTFIDTKDEQTDFVQDLRKALTVSYTHLTLPTTERV